MRRQTGGGLEGETQPGAVPENLRCSPMEFKRPFQSPYGVARQIGLGKDECK